MRSRLLPLLVAPILAATMLPAGPPAAQAAATPARKIQYVEWSGSTFAEGTFSGTGLVKDTLRIVKARSANGYEYARWLSPWVDPGFKLSELVSSWDARTPGNSYLGVQVRGIDTSGATSSWDTLGRWARTERYFQRTTLPGQPDDLGHVDYDTWVTQKVVQWQLRVTLYRKHGSKSPRVRTLGAFASRIPDTATVTTSTPETAQGTVLNVPRRSQMIHTGEYPQYDGGGEAWCSPTSTTMVLAYYDALPSAAAMAWVDNDIKQPEVDHAARRTFDAALQGTGNWPFNTAYAAAQGLHAFVTRLKSLQDAERFIDAGIPVVVSISFAAGQLDGAPISSTNGHLLVIVGFTSQGDVVVNDPAGARKSQVRRTYKRAQFENAWLKRYADGTGNLVGSGGLAYVIHDDAHPLPDRGSNRNW